MSGLEAEPGWPPRALRAGLSPCPALPHGMKTLPWHKSGYATWYGNRALNGAQSSMPQYSAASITVPQCSMPQSSITQYSISQSSVTQYSGNPLHHSTQTNDRGRDEISLAKGLTRIPPQRRGEGWKGKRDTPTNYQAIIYLEGGEGEGGTLSRFLLPSLLQILPLQGRGEGEGTSLAQGRQFVICGVFGGEGEVKNHETFSRPRQIGSRNWVVLWKRKGEKRKKNMLYVGKWEFVLLGIFFISFFLVRQAPGWF